VLLLALLLAVEVELLLQGVGEEALRLVVEGVLLLEGEVRNPKRFSVIISA
jgi:hypothetical protein